MDKGSFGQDEVAMNTKEIAREKISAFADGEATEQEADLTLVSLHDNKRHADWELYHCIGDVLRSSDMDVSLSEGFAAKMAARLEKEPAIVAPVSVKEPKTLCAMWKSRDNLAGIASAPRMKRFMLPSLVGAGALATFAFVTTPHLLVASKDTGGSNPSSSSIAATNQPKAINALAPTALQKPITAVNVSEGLVVRDARINDYLLAHQRFSPSVYSTAQYARSATFATESGK